MGASLSSQLCRAASNGDVGKITALLHAGADANSEDGSKAKWRPIHYAAEKDKAAAVSALRAAGAHANVMSSSGWFAEAATPLTLAIQNDASVATVLALLVPTENKEQGAPADVNATCTAGFTCLHYAAKRASQAGVIRALLQAGANANALTPRGEGALVIAARHGNHDNLRELLRASDNEIVERAFTTAMGGLDIGAGIILVGRVPASAVRFWQKQHTAAAIDLFARAAEQTTVAESIQEEITSARFRFHLAKDFSGYETEAELEKAMARMATRKAAAYDAATSLRKTAKAKRRCADWLASHLGVAPGPYTEAAEAEDVGIIDRYLRN